MHDLDIPPFIVLIIALASGMLGYFFNEIYISKHCLELNSFYTQGKVFYCKLDREQK